MNKLNLIAVLLFSIAASPFSVQARVSIGSLGMIAMDGGINGEYKSLTDYIDKTSSAYIEKLQGLITRGQQTGINVSHMQRELFEAQARQGLRRSTPTPTGLTHEKWPAHDPAFEKKFYEVSDSLILKAYHHDARVVGLRHDTMRQRLNDSKLSARSRELFYKPAVAVHEQVAERLHGVLFKTMVMDVKWPEFKSLSKTEFGARFAANAEQTKTEIIEELSYHILDFLTNRNETFEQSMHRVGGSYEKLNDFFTVVDASLEADLKGRAHVKKTLKINARSFPHDKGRFIDTFHSGQIKFDSHGGSSYFYALVYLGLAWLQSGLNDESDRQLNKKEMDDAEDMVIHEIRADKLVQVQIDDARIHTTGYAHEVSADWQIKRAEYARQNKLSGAAKKSFNATNQKLEKLMDDFGRFEKQYVKIATVQAGSGAQTIEREAQSSVAERVRQSESQRSQAGVMVAASGEEDEMLDRAGQEQLAALAAGDQFGGGGREMYEDMDERKDGWLDKLAMAAGIAVAAVALGSVVAHKVSSNTDGSAKKGYDKGVKKAVYMYGKAGKFILGLFAAVGTSTGKVFGWIKEKLPFGKKKEGNSTDSTSAETGSASAASPAAIKAAETAAVAAGSTDSTGA